ncbi:hypothetical protein LXL04_028015 [Taraxacum kok-saghyz]
MSSSSMKFDNQTLFNLANSIGSSYKVPTLFPNEYELWALHMEDYLLGLENGYLIWKSVSEGPHTFSATDEAKEIWVETSEQYEVLKSTPGITISKENRERIELDLKAKRELRFALPSNVFRLVRNCKTAHEIWEKLKVMYGGNEKQLKSQQTAALQEKGSSVTKVAIADCFAIDDDDDDRRCFPIDDRPDFSTIAIADSSLPIPELAWVASRVVSKLKLSILKTQTSSHLKPEPVGRLPPSGTSSCNDDKASDHRLTPTGEQATTVHPPLSSSSSMGNQDGGVVLCSTNPAMEPQESSSKFCDECKSNDFKYKCPGCSVRSCRVIGGICEYNCFQINETHNRENIDHLLEMCTAKLSPAAAPTLTNKLAVQKGINATTLSACKTMAEDLTKCSPNVPTSSDLRLENRIFYGLIMSGVVYLEFTSEKFVKLFDVLFVPKIRKNLVDSSCLISDGYKQVIKSDRYILSQGGMFIGFGYLNNRMFCLNVVNKSLHVQNSAFMSSSSSKIDDSVFWHARLGHVNFRRMHEMLKDGLIPAFDMDMEKCKTCMFTKVTKQLFPSVTRNSTC